LALVAAFIAAASGAGRISRGPQTRPYAATEEERERRAGGPAIGTDSPDEALKFRQAQWRDENGHIAENGLFIAKAHADAMRLQSAGPTISPSVAGIGPGSWTWLGPGNIGGRIRAIAIHPTTTSTWFAGSVGGGIWKTTNSGGAWAPVDDFMAALAVSTIVFNPANPSVMYAGTGEGFYNQDGIQGAGIFKSVDGGTTWSQLAATASSTFYYVNRLSMSADG